MPGARFLLSLVIPAIFLAGCSARVAVVPSPSPIDSVERLRADLDRIFSDPNFANAFWGVQILSLDAGDILFERNSARLLIPASTNKLITGAAALAQLGPDYRFETRIATDGRVEGDALKGNLVIAGSGDPTLNERFYENNAFSVFEEWASRLKSKGLRRIEGDIVGDDRAFDSPMLGRGWEWDNLAYGYAAPVNALQFNENLLTLQITPAGKEGDDAILLVRPEFGYLSVDSRVVTSARGVEARIEVARDGGEERVRVSGMIPLGGEAVTQTVAVESPTRFYLRALKLTLERAGIEVSHCEIRAARQDEPAATETLLTHASPPLSEIMKPFLKISQNLYAETLTRALGKASGRAGNFGGGREVVESFLAGAAIEKGTYSYADGSGLSRRNLISADQLVRLLKYMRRHRYFDTFFEALPVAGVDGTLRGRMKGTRSENNVRAKTGSLGAVRALSGYVRTADGELLAFAMLANNFLASSRAAEYVQDAALERLANFRR